MDNKRDSDCSLGVVQPSIFQSMETIVSTRRFSCCLNRAHFFCGVHIGACEDAGEGHSRCMLRVNAAVAPPTLEARAVWLEPFSEAHGRVG